MATLIDWLIYWLINWFINGCIDLLADWLIGWLVICLNWLVHSLINCLLVDCFCFYLTNKSSVFPRATRKRSYERDISRTCKHSVRTPWPESLFEVYGIQYTYHPQLVLNELLAMISSYQMHPSTPVLARLPAFSPTELEIVSFQRRRIERRKQNASQLLLAFCKVNHSAYQLAQES